MDDLIRKLQTQLNITEVQAKQAVNTVMDFVREKFPDVGSKVQGFVAGLDKDGDGLDFDDVKGAVSGMFSRKKDEGAPPETPEQLGS